MLKSMMKSMVKTMVNRHGANAKRGDARALGEMPRNAGGAGVAPIISPTSADRNFLRSAHGFWGMLTYDSLWLLPVARASFCAG